MTRTAIVNARLVLAARTVEGSLLLDGGVIAAVHVGASAPTADVIVDARNRYVAPGFIDIHVHGGGGFDLMTEDPQQVRAYARWAVRNGVTGFLVSTSGPDHATIRRRLDALAPIAALPPPANSARMLGFHLEGPYINPARKGAFPPGWLRAPSVVEYGQLVAASGGWVQQVTFAPELPDAEALARAIIASGATAAIGHTDATYEEARRAIGWGATHVTHCFNAMRPFAHRDPGVLAAVIADNRVTVELIGDGAHVDFAAARLLVRAKGAGRVALVTDGMPLAGTPDGEGEWEGTRIRVEGGKAIRVSDGTIIGGIITLDQAVRNAVAHLDVPAHHAVAMASTVPARVINRGDLGRLAPGCAADLVLLDEGLRVVETWVAGERVYAREGDG